MVLEDRTINPVKNSEVGVFFDVDGTVLHLKEPISSTYNRILQKHGFFVSEESIGSFMSKLWKEQNQKYLKTAKNHKTSVDEEIQFWISFASDVISPFVSSDVRNYIATEIYEHFKKGSSRFVDKQFLSAASSLKRQGAWIGAITNNDMRTHTVIEELNLSKVFSYVFTAGELGIKKPSIDIFKRAQETTPLPASQLWYVGDSIELDCEPAIKAGWNAILVNRDNKVITNSKIKSVNGINEVTAIIYG